MMGAGYCSTGVTSPSEAPGSSGAEPPLFFKESVIVDRKTRGS